MEPDCPQKHRQIIIRRLLAKLPKNLQEQLGSTIRRLVTTNAFTIGTACSGTDECVNYTSDLISEFVADGKCTQKFACEIDPNKVRYLSLIMEPDIPIFNDIRRLSQAEARCSVALSVKCLQGLLILALWVVNCGALGCYFWALGCYFWALGCYCWVLRC